MNREQLIRHIKTEFEKTGFVYLKNLSLEPKDLVAITQSLGEVIRYSNVSRLASYCLEDFDSIVVVTNKTDANGRPLGILGSESIPWHNDGSHIEYRTRESNTTYGGLNYCIQSDEFCTTTWMNLGDLLQTLPFELQQKFESLRAVHSTQSRKCRYKNLEEAEHPLVRFHPIFKRKYVYPSPQFLKKIIDWDFGGDPLDFMEDLISRYGVEVPVRWAVGDLVVHDTQLYMHKRTQTISDRNMWRMDFRCHRS